MKKFHVSKDGIARKCVAKSPESCRAERVEGLEGHYETREAAQKAFEQYMSNFDDNSLKLTKTNEIKLDHNDIQSYFNEKQAKLQFIYNTKGQGAARQASGDLYENLIDYILKSKKDYTSKKGSDDYLSLEYNHPDDVGIFNGIDNLQVDRHIWKENARHSFIEAKTYLDSPYLKRTVTDFLAIKNSLLLSNQNYKLNYIVFAGQNAISDKSRKQQEARFWTESNIDQINERIKLKIFYIHGTSHKRNPSKPIYSNNFPLDFEQIDAFYKIF